MTKILKPGYPKTGAYKAGWLRARMGLKLRRTQGHKEKNWEAHQVGYQQGFFEKTGQVIEIQIKDFS
jgi:hypothetical protein